MVTATGGVMLSEVPGNYCYIVRSLTQHLWDHQHLVWNYLQSMLIRHCSGLYELVRPVRPPGFGSSMLKVATMNWKVLAHTFVSIFVLVTIFLVYLTAVHNMGLAKAWLTQGLTITWYIAQSLFQCLWLLDLMTVQTIRIFPDYRVAWKWQLLLQLAVQ